ncbi:DNA helicase [Giardia muris]|uniref:DNA helicase n=1 Tax=Giardia muris TaxID=5742 RepID=A0A4Z1SWH0_GIAMU|nr:DNA helicase [Giardia muris]|eukprot:TNJ30114.1 DNA helicase [Giardia muris]
MLRVLDSLALALSTIPSHDEEETEPVVWIPRLEATYSFTPAVTRLTRFEKTLFTETSRAVERLLQKERELREEYPKDTNDYPLMENSFGLPKDVIAGLPMKNLLCWQHDLLHKAVPDTGTEICHRHILLSAPTSAGKSLVALIFILRCLVLAKKSAIMAVPFVALADELVIKMQAMAPTGCGVIGITGMKQLPRITGTRPMLYICTYEKAVLVFRKFMQKGLLSQLGLLVFDEIHLIGDGSSRSCKLELFLSQLIIIERTQAANYRIIGMSATLSNIQDLQKWLGCFLYECTFRPVTLQEYVVHNGELYSIGPGEGEKPKVTSQGPISVRSPKTNEDLRLPPLYAVSLLALKPLIIFVTTKNSTVQVATEFARIIAKHFPSPPQEIIQKRADLLGELKSLGNESWTALITSGVMYHNSSLASMERTLIEDAFTNVVIHTIVATTTISAGVNLPARSVIISYPSVGDLTLTGAKYRQMIGRAGRMGLAQTGHSFLVLERKRELQGKQGQALLDELSKEVQQLRTLQPTLSSLSKSGINAEVILNSCIYDVSVKAFVESTLAYVQGLLKVEDLTVALETLEKLNLVTFSDNVIRLTLQGRACVEAGVDIYNSKLISLYIDDFARNGLLVGNDLHLCCTLLPIHNLLQENTETLQGLCKLPANLKETSLIRPKYELLYDQLVLLPEELTKPVLQRFDLTLGLLEEKMLNSNGPCPIGLLIVYNGLLIYTFLLRAEQPGAKLANVFTGMRSTFDVDGGTLETLLKTVVQQGNAMAQFTDSLGKVTISQVYKTVSERLRRLALDDITDLLIIPGVAEKRARALRDAGYRNVEQIIEAGLERLMKTVDFGGMTEAVCTIIYKGAERLWDALTKVGP